jgi:hypothetical protein
MTITIAILAGVALAYLVGPTRRTHVRRGQ